MSWGKTAFLLGVFAALIAPSADAAPADITRAYVAAHRKQIVEEYSNSSQRPTCMAMYPT
jgi:hypothetical protein